MNNTKQRRLEAEGWKVGGAEDFLGLSAEEAAYIEMKLALSRKLRELRKEKGLTQVQAAKLLQTSQSRLAKLEAGDASVSLDLLIRSTLALGASKHDLARTISSAGRLAAA